MQVKDIYLKCQSRWKYWKTAITRHAANNRDLRTTMFRGIYAASVMGDSCVRSEVTRQWWWLLEHLIQFCHCVRCKFNWLQELLCTFNTIKCNYEGIQIYVWSFFIKYKNVIINKLLWYMRNKTLPDAWCYGKKYQIWVVKVSV